MEIGNLSEKELKIMIGPGGPRIQDDPGSWGKKNGEGVINVYQRPRSTKE